MRVEPPGRWENSTRYSLSIAGAVEDLYGHTGDVAFSAEFRTWAQPKVLTVAPQGESQPVESAIQIEFERDVDRASLQERVPRSSLPYSGTLRVDQSERIRHLAAARARSTPPGTRRRSGARRSGGDTFVGPEWSFRTHDPPVFVEIKGRKQAPTVLEAFPSGGLGNFALPVEYRRDRPQDPVPRPGRRAAHRRRDRQQRRPHGHDRNPGGARAKQRLYPGQLSRPAGS